jgi:hypothetical protein
MVEHDRQEIIGHILKKIIIRMDFQDIIRVSNNGLKEIQTVCFKNNLDASLTRTLSPFDFDFSDYLTEMNIPYEYIKDITSHVFFNRQENLTVEVNQFFIKVTQDVGNDYIRFSEMERIFLALVKVLQTNEEIRTRRFSLTKTNEVFYENPKKLVQDFRKEIVGLDFYGDMVDWMNPLSQMNQTLNFMVDDLHVNVAKLLDNGIIENKPLIRLLFQFEALCVDKPFVEPADLLTQMNEQIYNVFKASLSEEGLKKISVGERLGDYHEQISD